LCCCSKEKADDGAGAAVEVRGCRNRGEKGEVGDDDDDAAAAAAAAVLAGMGAMMACVDTSGVGCLTARHFALFVDSASNQKECELGRLWVRLRAAAAQCPKLASEKQGQSKAGDHDSDGCHAYTDALLFRRFDPERNGTVTGEELKRGLKHLKGPQLPKGPSVGEGSGLKVLRAAFGAADTGLDPGPNGEVNYLRFGSWLSPVPLGVERLAKRAHKALKRALGSGYRHASEEDFQRLVPSEVSDAVAARRRGTTSAVQGGEGGVLVLDVEGLCAVLSGSAVGLGECTPSEARALLLRASATPARLEIGAAGLLCLAKNVPSKSSAAVPSSNHNSSSSAASHNSSSSLADAPSLGASGSDGVGVGAGSSSGRRSGGSTKHSSHRNDDGSREEYGGGGSKGGGQQHDVEERARRPQSASNRPQSGNRRTRQGHSGGREALAGEAKAAEAKAAEVVADEEAGEREDYARKESSRHRDGGKRKSKSSKNRLGPLDEPRS